MEKVKKHIFFILVILLSFFAIAALLQPGFFPIHDDEQVGRLYELNYSLESLHIPPRISQNLGFGYGYPFFNFYPSFVYYVGEIFVLLGFSYIVSIKIMVGLGFVLSALFMYLFSRRHIGELGGLVASVLYLYAPYHSLDAYVRGAFPEFWSFVFIPAVFWAIDRTYKNSSVGNIVLLGFLGAFLMLTHNLITLMSIPFFFLYYLFILYKNKEKKNITVSLISGGIIALLLSAYFWIPAILENKYTMVSLLTNQLASYGLHFVSLPQFINSPWGYGGSILGPMDGFSLEIGKIQLILAGAVGIFILISIARKKYKIDIALLFLIMFALSVFLQSYYSKFIWDHIFALSYIQFPWRFMLFSVFTSAFLGGYLFSLKFDSRLKYIFATGLIIGTIIFYGSLFQPSKYLTSVTDKDYIDQSVIRWKTSAMAFEYVPAGIATKNSSLNTTIVDIDQSGVAKETATALDENTLVNTLVDKPQYKKIEINSEKGGKVRINTFSFPGWKVFINDRETVYNDENKLKLIDITVPEGKSIVEVKLTDTSIRLVANLLTLIGLILVIISVPFYSRKVNL